MNKHVVEGTVGNVLVLVLAFTRYSFTSRLSCTNEPSFHSPSPPSLPTLLQIHVHEYWTVYDSPSDFMFVCYTPYYIGNNKIV